MSDYGYIERTYGKKFHINDIVKLDELPDALNGRVLKGKPSSEHYVHVEFKRQGQPKTQKGLFHPNSITVIWSPAS